MRRSYGSPLLRSFQPGSGVGNPLPGRSKGLPWKGKSIFQTGHPIIHSHTSDKTFAEQWLEHSCTRGRQWYEPVWNAAADGASRVAISLNINPRISSITVPKSRGISVRPLWLRAIGLLRGIHRISLSDFASAAPTGWSRIAPGHAGISTRDEISSFFLDFAFSIH